MQFKTYRLSSHADANTRKTTAAFSCVHTKPLIHVFVDRFSKSSKAIKVTLLGYSIKGGWAVKREGKVYVGFCVQCTTPPRVRFQSARLKWRFHTISIWYTVWTQRRFVTFLCRFQLLLSSCEYSDVAKLMFGHYIGLYNNVTSVCIFIGCWLWSITVHTNTKKCNLSVKYDGFISVYTITYM